MSSEASPLLDARIKLNSNEAQFVQSLLEQWRNRQLLSPGTCAQLLGTIEAQDAFEWHRLAKYTFRLSLACLAIAVISLIFDSAFLKLIYKVLEINAYTRAATTTAVSVSIHYHAYRRSQKLPAEVWMNEAIHAVGAIVLSLGALQLAEAVHGLRMHNGGVIDVRGRRVMWLLACAYALIGIATTSNFIWSCGIVTMGIWAAFWVPQRYVEILQKMRIERRMDLEWKYGSWTGPDRQRRGTLNIFQGNYPIRFVILGGILISTACCMRMHPRTSSLWSSTRIWGLTYLFLFGLGYGSAINMLEEHWRTSSVWLGVRWTLALTAAAGASTWHGLKYDDATTRGFGLVFLALDIYTRYGDFFWRSMYRPLFFTVLAGSFALVGWGAEQMWRAKAERRR
jgi:hypothetical protein